MFRWPTLRGLPKTLATPPAIPPHRILTKPSRDYPRRSDNQKVNHAENDWRGELTEQDTQAHPQAVKGAYCLRRHETPARTHRPQQPGPARILELEYPWEEHAKEDDKHCTKAHGKIPEPSGVQLFNRMVHH